MNFHNRGSTRPSSVTTIGKRQKTKRLTGSRLLCRYYGKNDGDARKAPLLSGEDSKGRS